MNFKMKYLHTAHSCPLGNKLMQNKIIRPPLDRKETAKLSSPKIWLELLTKPFHTSRLRATYKHPWLSLQFCPWEYDTVPNDDCIVSSPQASQFATFLFPKGKLRACCLWRHTRCTTARAIRRMLYLLKRHLQVGSPPWSAHCTCAGAGVWSTGPGGGQSCAESPPGP